jgi:hypothetical protein
MVVNKINCSKVGMRLRACLCVVGLDYRHLRVRVKLLPIIQS